MEVPLTWQPKPSSISPWQLIKTRANNGGILWKEMADWEREKKKGKQEEKVPIRNSSVATGVSTPGVSSLADPTCWPSEMSAPNPSRALWLLKFLSGKNIPAVDWRDVSLALTKLPESLPGQSCSDAWVRVANLYLRIPSPCCPCGNIFEKFCIFIWWQPVLHSTPLKHDALVSLNNKTLSFPEMKGDYKAGL